jgi:hypothetical protein
MSRSNSEKVADKFIQFFADGRIDKADWRLLIPRHFAHQPEVVRVNAKNFADGIKDFVDSQTRETLFVDLDKYDRVGE